MNEPLLQNSTQATPFVCPPHPPPSCTSSHLGPPLPHPPLPSSLLTHPPLCCTARPLYTVQLDPSMLYSWTPLCCTARPLYTVQLDPSMLYSWTPLYCTARPLLPSMHRSHSTHTQTYCIAIERDVVLLCALMFQMSCIVTS